MSDTTKRFRDCIWLLIAQAIGAFNDNATKAMLPALAAFVIGKGEMDPVNQQVSLMLIVPFVLFGPLAGWLSDRFSKRKVTSVALFAQIVGLAVLCVGMGMELFYLSLVGFFLLAVQSAMLSPAKKGILKELVGSRKLGMAVGWMEMLTMVGILTGAFVGATVFNSLIETHGGWRAGLWVSAGVGVLAVFSWVIFRPTPEVAPRSTQPFQVAVLFSHFKDLAYLWKEKPLRLAALGDAWFWAFGTFFYLVLVKLAGEVVPGNVDIAPHYGLWFLLLGVGIMVGSLVVAYVNRGRVDLGLVPVGAIIMPVILFTITNLDPLESSFRYCCVALGMGGAFFFVPLNAFLQDKAGEERRGRVVAASNLLTNLLVIALIGVHAYLSNTLKLGAQQEFLVMAVPSTLLAIYVMTILPEAFFRTLATLISSIFYRVKMTGTENLPREGGTLLLCNHLSYADPVLVGANVPREVQFLAFSGLAESRFVRLVFRLSSTIPVSPTRAKDAIQTAAQRLKKGETICIFPEGGISRIGPMMTLKKGYELIARRGDATVVPIYLDGMWGSMFSFSGGRFFRKWPRRLPYPVRLRIGEPITAKEAKTDRVRQAIQRLSREAFAERLELQRSLAEVLEEALMRKSSGAMISITGENIQWARGEFLEIAKGLSEKSEGIGTPDEDASLSDALPLLAARALAGEDIRAGGQSWSSMELMASIMRISETSLWSLQSFRVQLVGNLDSPWDQTWLLWAPALGGLAVKDDGDGFVTLSRSGKSGPDQPETYAGLALPGLGVVALNLPDPPRHTNPDKQKGSADDSLGLLLAGLETRVASAGEESTEACFLEVAGVEGEWVATDQRVHFDEEGFLFMEENASSE